LPEFASPSLVGKVIGTVCYFFQLWYRMSLQRERGYIEPRRQTVTPVSRTVP
jgi:hypothetical protein